MGDVRDEVAPKVRDALQFGEQLRLRIPFAGERPVAGDEADGEEQDEEEARGADEGGEDHREAVAPQRIDDDLVGQGQAHDEVVPRLPCAVEHLLPGDVRDADGAPRAGFEGGADLGAAGVVAGGGRFGIVDHPAGGGEHREAQVVRAAHVGELAQAVEVPRREGVADGGRGQFGAGGEVAFGPGLGQSARGVHFQLQDEAERDEANGREGAGEIADEGRLHGFTRYPTPRMVSMCAAQSPSFLRRPTSWTSTVRSVTDFSSSWIEAMIWLRV